MLLTTASHNAVRTAALRHRLAGLRTTLEEEVQACAAEDSGGDRDAALSVIQTQAETSRAITAAIARVDAGTYGLCDSCHRNIDDLRLRALPLATLCRGCDEVSSA
jgi:DnaK suppressor protein